VPGAQGLARDLLAKRDAFLARLDGLAGETGALVKTRYHGDLHLGQVLVVQNDFAIVDFEGEPARPIQERRRKHSVLRDVAGMLRSIRYAAHAAGLRPAGDASPDVARLKVETWASEAAERFLAGYREAGAGVASIPSDPARFRALLDLFVVEKALYEVRYELSHRPDWVAIPLRGLHEWIGP
jgi:maltose alpha-D-glucosyltransferase/alpha-amylase